MRRMMRRKEMAEMMVTGLLLLVASESRATCFKDCASSGAFRSMTTPTIERNPVLQTQQSQDSFNRLNSHDVTNTKNAIVGDVNIKVGHDKMEFTNGNNSEVNASVTSIINFGDTISTGDRHN